MESEKYLEAEALTLSEDAEADLMMSRERELNIQQGLGITMQTKKRLTSRNINSFSSCGWYSPGDGKMVLALTDDSAPKNTYKYRIEMTPFQYEKLLDSLKDCALDYAQSAELTRKYAGCDSDA